MTNVLGGHDDLMERNVVLQVSQINQILLQICANDNVRNDNDDHVVLDRKAAYKFIIVMSRTLKSFVVVTVDCAMKYYFPMTGNFE